MDGQWSELQERLSGIKIQSERRTQFLMPLLTYLEKPGEMQQSAAVTTQHKI
jgi:hypothetical protein